MYQKIAETIAVVGSYNRHHFIPRKFLWRNREFIIKEITLISDVRDGAVKLRWYSVLVGQEVYRLLFNRDSETWTLDELWID